ncbi:MAG: glycosyltransferase family 4 protein [Chloroflexota bacterium]
MAPPSPGPQGVGRPVRLRLPGMNRALALREVRSILRYRKLAAFHRLSGRASPKLRDRALRPPLAVAQRMAERDPGHAVWAPTAVLLCWEVGRTQEALDLLHRGLAVAEPTALLRLALVAVVVGWLDETRPFAERLPEGPLRRRFLAELAIASGRYQETIELAGGLTGLSDRGRRLRLVGRAEAELRVLDPAWRPALPPRAVPGWTPTPGRVLHLLTNSLPYRQNGYSLRAQQIALAQRGVGLDPHLATRAGFPLSEGRAGAPSRERVEGVPYYRIRPDMPLSGAPDVLATETAAGLDALVAELRPAVLHPTTNHPNAQVALALRERYPLRVVYEVRGFLEETWVSRTGGDGATADRYVLGRTVETACMAAADAVVTLSETMKADIVARGIPPEKVVVVPNAVDPARFAPRPRDEALCARLGFEKGETVLGYVSSMVGYEGIGYLIEATRILRDRGRRVRLLLVGDGEERGALEERARALGLLDGGVARFAGRVPHGDVGAYYSLIDLFVVPRTNDRVSQLVTPLKPYEAMAMERCLVVSGVGALLEIVQDGETGTSFAPEDPVALADAVEPLLDAPGERARLGANARAWVLANRTWARNAELYRALYERLGAV